MSKEKPEAGDVWSWNGVKIFITCVLGDEEIGAISFMDNRNGHHCTDSFGSFDRKIKAGVLTYLGKSKVSIKELFEIKKENNEKDKLVNDLKQIVRDSAKQAREIIDNWNKGVV